jgi:hypothetical protein
MFKISFAALIAATATTLALSGNAQAAAPPPPSTTAIATPRLLHTTQPLATVVRCWLRVKTPPLDLKVDEKRFNTQSKTL